MAIPVTDPNTQNSIHIQKTQSKDTLPHSNRPLIYHRTPYEEDLLGNIMKVPADSLELRFTLYAMSGLSTNRSG